MDVNVIQDCEKKINKIISLSWDDLAKKYNYKSGEVLRCTYKKYRKQHNLLPEKNTFPESTSINADGSYTDEKIIKAQKNELKNPEFLLKQHGYDIECFELIKAHSAKWNCFSNTHGMQDLYSSKICVKPKQTPITLDSLSKHFIEMVKKYKPQVYQQNYQIDNKKYTLEIPLFDVHFGRVAWKEETGENCDHKITENDLWQVIDDMLAKIDTSKVKRILFPVGSDFFNADTISGTTTKGTLVSSDLRWQKMFLKGCSLLVDVITRLSSIASVKVFYVPGNHDHSTSFYAISYLDAWFQNNKIVTVDKSIKTRYYESFGKNLIGYTHGNLEKNRIKTIMQSEVAEQWGMSIFREWHMGHFHSEKAILEEGGLIIRNLSSIVKTDAWHYESGYIGAIKKLQCFLWDDDEGLINIIHTLCKDTPTS